MAKGVVHGRFQPLHLDHMKYILASFERSSFVFIGITNPDPETTAMNERDLNRSESLANPLTYWERLLILEASLAEFDVPRDSFSIIPFPISKPDLIKFYSPLDATYFLTIYDEWGKYKRETLLSLGLNVETLWERNLSEKGITATRVRNLISTGGNWESLMPTAAVRLMKELALDVRIRDLYSVDR